MSPLHETEQDVANETRIIDAYCEKRKLGSLKLGMHYGIDFALYKGEIGINNRIVAFAEVKSRPGLSITFDEAMFGLEKVIAAWDLYRATKLPVMLLYEWRDCLGVLDISNCRDICRFGATTRKDRNETTPKVFIDLEHFRLEYYDEVRQEEKQL